MKKTILSLTAVLALFVATPVYASHAELWPVTDTRLPQIVNDFKKKKAALPVLNIKQLKDIFKATETDMYQFLHALQVTDWAKQKEAFSLSDRNFGSVIQFLDSNLYPPETRLFVHDLSKYVDAVYSAYVYKHVSLTAKNKYSPFPKKPNYLYWMRNPFTKKGAVLNDDITNQPLYHDGWKC